MRLLYMMLPPPKPVPGISKGSLARPRTGQEVKIHNETYIFMNIFPFVHLNRYMRLITAKSLHLNPLHISISIRVFSTTGIL